MQGPDHHGVCVCVWWGCLREADLLRDARFPQGWQERSLLVCRQVLSILQETSKKGWQIPLPTGSNSNSTSLSAGCGLSSPLIRQVIPNLTAREGKRGREGRVKLPPKDTQSWRAAL